MNRHTGGGIRKGKRVQVVLYDGTRYIDKFVATASRWIVLEQQGKVLTKDIRSLAIYKPS